MKRIIFMLMLILNFCGVTFAGHEPPGRRDAAQIKEIIQSCKKHSDPATHKELNIVLVATDTNYSPQSHQYLTWQRKWSNLLSGKSESNLDCSMYGPTTRYKKDCGVSIENAYHFPSDGQLKNADLVIFYCYVDFNGERLTRLENYVKRGGGLVFIHNTVWTNNPGLAEIIGVAFIFDKSKYIEGPCRIELDTSKDICHAMPDHFDLVDEVYYQGKNQKEVETVASWEQKTEDGKIVTWPIVWKYSLGKGRVFVNMLGHYNWTFDDPFYRLITLRGIAWAGGSDVYRFDENALLDSWSR